MLHPYFHLISSENNECSTDHIIVEIQVVREMIKTLVVIISSCIFYSTIEFKCENYYYEKYSRKTGERLNELLTIESIFE